MLKALGKKRGWQSLDPLWRRVATIIFILCISAFVWLPNAGKHGETAFVAKHNNGSKRDDWIIRLHDFTSTIGPKSQGAQDFYLYNVFEKIGTTNQYFVEFGFNEPSYISGGSGANTRNLYDHGWRGLLLDAERENLEINLHKHYLYQNNVVKIFEIYGVPRELDFLSCDMDSHDLFVLEAILQGGYRPRVMTTEFNSNYPLGLSITQVDPTLQPTGEQGYLFNFRQCAWGASATALESVAKRHGYTLIGRVGYLDLLWLRNDLVQEEWLMPDFDWFFDKGMGRIHHAKQTSDEIFEHLLDYNVYVATGNLRVAKEAAKSALLAANLSCFLDIEK